MADDTLSHDGAAWEALERLMGQDPDALPYPDDIAARIEAWMDDSGMRPVLEAIIERIRRTGEGVKFSEHDGLVQFVPRPAEASEWEADT